LNIVFHEFSAALPQTLVLRRDLPPVGALTMTDSIVDDDDDDID